MSPPQRLEFVTRHFMDLQTIRFAPVPAAMLLAPFAARRMPHLSPAIAWAILLSYLFCVGGFYWWCTTVIRRRYGLVQLSREESRRMARSPIILSLSMIMLAVLTWLYFAAPHGDYWDIYIAFAILIAMLRTILDSTNPAARRIAWAAGLVVLFTAGPLLLDVAGGAIALAGAVWLSLSILDFLLLRHSFAGTPGAPFSAGTGALMPRG